MFSGTYGRIRIKNKTRMSDKNPKTSMIITIDGPAGSGKTTVASLIANKLGLVHLNSGLLYRTVGVLAGEAGIDLGDEKALANLAKQTEFQFFLNADRKTCFTANGKDLSERLSTEQAAECASKVAVMPLVREALSVVQRKVAEKFPVVLEGRDAGTVVFPNAPYKFFLEASVSERAKRRLKDELAKGNAQATLETVVADISRRDLRDTTRKIAPGIKADDAVLIQTDGLSIEQVLEKIEFLVK
jgi:cytidylate kinase